MEGLAVEGFGGVKRKRSATSRRPRPGSHFAVEGRDRDPASLASTPSDENGGRHSPDRAPRKYGDVSGFYQNGGPRCSEGVLAPANWRGSGSADVGNGGTAEVKLRKVTLRVKPLGPARQDDSDQYGQAQKQNYHGELIDESSYGKQMSLAEPVRKSRRASKRRVLETDLDDGDEDDEIRYLEKLKASKGGMENSVFGDDIEGSIKKTNKFKVSNIKRGGYDVDEDYGSSRSAKENKRKSRTGLVFEDKDYVEDEEPNSADGIDPRRKSQKKDSISSLPDTREPLTTRQRALQSGKGSSPGDSLIEFPNGLPPAPPRRQKEKLSEVEQQAKKAEAALRRKMQVEKAAKESQEEAIRKILGQDSNRKKKEEKIRKERDEMAQKKAAESLVLAPNSIRTVMGPTGTIVTFGEGVGLPSIFDRRTVSYPPPREKCGGPSCTNPYKYRDSKTSIPLCSLECYKAVQERPH